MSESIDALAAQLAELQQEVSGLRKAVSRHDDIQAVRKLHFTYGYLIDHCRYDETVDLFADDGEVYFLNGIYKGREGARRLYCGWFREMFTRGVNGPIEGFLLDHFLAQDIVDISEDGNTAWLRGRCIMQAGYHETVESLVPEMPRSCWEGGIHRNTYVKENGTWKIRTLDYNMLWQADYEKGWGHSYVHLQPLEKTFPEDPNGPDALRDYIPPVWPKTRNVDYHYNHPVNGKPIPYNP